MENETKMEIDERIDFDELRCHPNKLAVLWSMADFIRPAAEELLTKEKLERSLGYHQPTDTASADVDF